MPYWSVTMNALAHCCQIVSLMTLFYIGWGEGTISMGEGQRPHNSHLGGGRDDENNIQARRLPSMSPCRMLKVAKVVQVPPARLGVTNLKG